MFDSLVQSTKGRTIIIKDNNTVLPLEEKEEGEDNES